MDATDYERLKEAAEREHRLNMEAIDRVRRMEQSLAGSAIMTANANGTPGGQAAPKRNRRSGANGGKVLKVLREAVSFQQGEFTRRMVEDHLKLKYPKATIKEGSMKSALKRLADAGEIEIVVSAQGRRHAVYRRGQPARSETEK